MISDNLLLNQVGCLVFIDVIYLVSIPEKLLQIADIAFRWWSVTTPMASGYLTLVKTKTSSCNSPDSSMQAQYSRLYFQLTKVVSVGRTFSFILIDLSRRTFTWASRTFKWKIQLTLAIIDFY